MWDTGVDKRLKLVAGFDLSVQDVVCHIDYL